MGLGNILNVFGKSVYHVPANGIGNPVGVLTIGGNVQGATDLKDGYLEGKIPRFYVPFVIYTLRKNAIDEAYIGAGNGRVLHATQRRIKLMSGEELTPNILNSFNEVLSYIEGHAALIKEIAYSPFVHELNGSSEVTIEVPIKPGIEALIEG